MREIVIWMTRHDGVTHWATVNDDPCAGRILQSMCGLVSRLPWEHICPIEITKVTCPACRREGVRNVNAVPKAA